VSGARSRLARGRCARAPPRRREPFFPTRARRRRAAGRLFLTAHAPPRSIKQLAKLLAAEAPACIKEVKIADFNGRKLAIDASMAIYQFLVRARRPARPRARGRARAAPPSSPPPPPRSPSAPPPRAAAPPRS